MTLEELQPNATIRGILPDAVVTVVGTQWFGSEALELTFKDPSGRLANQLLYRDDEPRLGICCNFPKAARERLVELAGLRLMPPPRTSC